MIGTLALALVTITAEALSPTVEATPTLTTPSLTIDECAAVDDEAVRQLVDLEIRGQRAFVTAVSVQCTGDDLEIHGASGDNEDVRTIQLARLAGSDSAARQARSRELALAIAELIRRQEKDPPAHAIPPPVPSPAAIVAEAAPREIEKAGRWQLGATSAVEFFSGGSRLSGGDVSLGSRPGGRFVVDMRLGGRFGPDENLPGGRLVLRAGVASLGVGVSASSTNQTVTGGVLVRAQGYLVRYGVEGLDETDRRATLAAFSVAAEASVLVAVTRWLGLKAAVDLGGLPRGIDLRVQGLRAQSISGMVAAGNLGAMLTF